MAILWQDLRYGARMLAKNPGFASVAVITLALGIGANSALFSVVNAILLRPFPYGEPERLVVVWETQLSQSLPAMFASPPNYRDWRGQQTVFDEMAAFNPRGFFLAQNAEQTRAQGAQVSATLFPLLQVKPLLGRTFSPDDENPGANRVVMLGYGLWARNFGGDRNVIGRSIIINEQPHTVIGVMPPEFNFPPPIDLEGTSLPQRNELWVPFDLGRNAEQRGAHFMTVIARLKPGVVLERANEEMNTIAGRLERQYPASNAGWKIALVPLNQQALGKVDAALMALLAAVAFVLLIACVNVANMLLARSAGRAKEFAIRAALGAGQWRLVRQSLTESMLLGLSGGVAGLLLAYWGVKLIVGVAPQNIPRLEEVTVNSPVVVFTLALSLLTGVLAGIIPALRGPTARLYQTLKEGGSASGEGAAAWLRDGLVIAEVALALALLAGAGLFAQSFLRLRGVDKGFQSENVLTMSVRLPPSKYQQAGERSAAFTELERRLKTMPGVESVAFTSDIPIGADWQGTDFMIEGEPPPPPDQERHINWTTITPGYLRTMGVSLLRGREFTEQDGPDAPKVVLVNETLARRYFPNNDPIGKRIVTGFSTQFAREIIGVVKDIKHSDLQSASTAQVFAPYHQTSFNNTLSLLIRSRAPSASVFNAARDRILDFERGSAIYEARTMERVVAESIALPRFSMLLTGLFAVVAALLAAAGVYGVVSYVVSRHTREIGLRMALGAEPRDILKLIIGQGLRPVLIGAGVGVAASVALTRFLSSLLFGVSATDPLTFMVITLLLITVAGLACFIPARRAMKVDPMVALRCE
jgi:putative ABC transport system permease protein